MSKAKYPEGLPAEILKDLKELGPKEFVEKHKVGVGTYYAWRKKYGISASTKSFTKSTTRRVGSKLVVQIEVGDSKISIPLKGDEVRIKLGRG